MRLLHIETEELHTFSYPPPVSYAILSRAGSSPAGGERLRYDSSSAIISGHPSTLHADILQFCKLAREAQFQFVWVDTLCVDKTSSADISETINALPGYFQNAGICFVFLEDLRGGPSLPWEDTWAKCQYWTRAWTLQELLLPAKVQFYDAQWHLRGERSTYPLPSLISGTTGIDEDILTRRGRLHQISVARRMSWAARREGRRPEDLAYSLLGIFDVRMPIIYGEGGRRAFRRLQEEILKNTNDMSLFSWTSDVADDRRGIFANSPGEFFRFGASPGAHTPCLSPGFAALTSRGVLVEGQCCEEGQILYLDLGVQTCDESNTKRYGILLEKRADGTFQRTKSNVLEELPIDKVLKTGRIMASKGPVDFCDTASSVTSKLSSSLDSRHQILPFRHAIPISLSKPTTPGFSRQSSGSSGSETTLTGPSFSSCPSHLEEPDWVSIQHESQEAAESDGCDDFGGYGSMETSQQTEADQGWDSISEASTAPSPPQDETEEPCQPSADPLCDSAITRSTSTTMHQSPFPATTVDDSQLKEQLSRFLLGQFVASQETWNHVAEKRERREKRSRDRSRHQAQKLKRRALGPLEFSCPFYVKNPERNVGCLINHELVSMDDVREHVWLHHRLPCYCPTCKAVFEAAVERDVHIVQRNCSFIDNVPFEGVSEDHRRLIFHTRDSANSSTQWLQIWDVLFPDVEVDRSKTVHLSDSLGLKVSGFRAFCRKYGRVILGEQLVARYPKAAMPEETAVEDLLCDIRSDITRALVHDFFRRDPCTRYTLSR